MFAALSRPVCVGVVSVLLASRVSDDKTFTVFWIIIPLLTKCCSFLLWRFFFIVFSFQILGYGLGVGSLGFISLGFYSASWICRFLSLARFEKFSTITSLSTFSGLCFPLFIRDSDWIFRSCSCHTGPQDSLQLKKNFNRFSFLGQQNHWRFSCRKYMCVHTQTCVYAHTYIHAYIFVWMLYWDIMHISYHS